MTLGNHLKTGKMVEFSEHLELCHYHSIIELY